MNYELVKLEEKKVAGLRARTGNTDPEMGSKIGLLWQSFYADGICQSLPGKKNDKSIGLYTNYENGVGGTYDVLVCAEVNDLNSMPENVETEIIEAGTYAKFVIHGHVQQAVAEFWGELWGMDLDRKFGCDFEEYQAGGDMDNAEIHIYISLNA